METNMMDETPEQEAALNEVFMQGFRQAVDSIVNIIDEFTDPDGVTAAADIIQAEIEKLRAEWEK